MQKKFKLVMVLALVCFAAAPAFAADTKFGAEVFGAFNSYSMSDVNDHQIKELNDSQNTNFNDVTSGLTGGINARMWANQRWMFSAGWEPLFLETKSDATSEKWNLDANAFTVNGTYFFPSKKPTSKYGIGAGVGYYSLGGEFSDPSGTTKVEGSGPGFQFSGVGEWTMSPGFAVTGSAGYRVASIEVDQSNPKSNADYSGFTGRLGLAFYLPQSSK